MTGMKTKVFACARWLWMHEPALSVSLMHVLIRCCIPGSPCCVCLSVSPGAERLNGEGALPPRAAC